MNNAQYDLKTITLERAKMVIKNSFATGKIGTMYRADVIMQEAMQRMVVMFERDIFRETLPEKTYQHPATWWDAYKAGKYFPTWARKRWPVKYNKLTVGVHICYPALKASIPDEPNIIKFYIREN